MREIEDQHHAAVAQDGSAADQIGFHRLVVQRLNDQFFFAFQAVHDHARACGRPPNDQHKNLLQPLSPLEPRAPGGQLADRLRSCKTSQFSYLMQSDSLARVISATALSGIA